MTPQGAGEAAFRSAEDVSRETIVKLRQYADLLAEWNAFAGLVGPSTLEDVWVRHFLDSAQLLRLRPKHPSTWLDLGSGGGFPGMVLAIVAAETAPECSFSLLESNRRKCQFLKHVARNAGVDVEIRAVRAESAEPAQANVVTARALAPLKRLLTLAHRHLGAGGMCLFLKGRNADEDLASARGEWEFDLKMHPSVSDPSGCILQMKELRRA